MALLAHGEDVAEHTNAASSLAMHLPAILELAWASFASMSAGFQRALTLSTGPII